METNRTILVTGANGQLGNCLREIAPTTTHRFIFTDVTELDITSRDAVRAMFDREKPNWVVNCAAYTAVDKAESQPDLALMLNATAVEILATEAQRIGAAIVHVSTDYVFKGDNPEPRKETDPTEPQSVYGATKLDGEKAAALNPRHIILRTSWLYSIYGNNFVKTMRRLGAEKSEISVVADQWGSPTSAHDLARAIITTIDKPEYGIYHFSNEGITNWAIFAEEIMTQSGLDCKVNHITTDQYPTAAKRPEFSIMAKDKFSSVFNVVIPEWEISLEDVIQKLDNNGTEKNI